MSVAPVPAHAAVKRPVDRSAEAVFGRQPVPAHKIVAKNGVSIAETADPAQAPTSAPPADKPFSFWDLVDIVNPLQHIPVVGTLYRQLTGDEINGFGRVAGGALFGGVLGAAVGGINAILAADTGKDVGDTVMAFLTGNDDAPQTITAPDQASQELAQNGADNGPGSGNGPAGYNGVPIIEVRPEPFTARGAAATTLAPVERPMPASRDIAALNDVDPTAGAATAPAPVAKANVQHAMMNALLKMQAIQPSGDAATVD